MKNSRIIIVNTTLFVSIAILLLLFKLCGKPFTQGFYCDDKSINKPYNASTVPIFGLFISALILAVCCFVFGIYRKFIQGTNEEFGCCNYKIYVFEMFVLMIMFIYGSGITIFVTEVGKYSIGRLRPHYFSVCRPDWLKINCTNTIGEKNLINGNEFCQTADLKILKDSQLSFPSGHASFSGFSATFLVLYLESQIKYTKWESVPKYFLQVLITIIASCVGLSRITDYMHHPTDVLAGFVLGMFIGILMHCSLVKYYYPRIPTNSSDNREIKETSNY